MSGHYDEVTMQTMGKLNAGWGICGITSTFYAMYQTNPGKHSVLINAPRPYTVLAEIKTFLATLRAEGKTDMVRDIEAFTRTFGVVNGTDFSKFTVAGYIQYVNNSLSQYVNNVTSAVDDAIMRDNKFGIALPPEVVAHYARRVWGYTATAAMSDQGGDAIVGVKNGSRWFNGSRLYNGLIHYVYRKNGKIYSWGKEPFDTLKGANANYELCCTVKLTPA